MLKLYKRDEQGLLYHEAWFHDGEIHEHRGRVGDIGESREHPCSGDPEQAIRELLAPVMEAGFAPWDEDEMWTLQLTAKLEGWGSTEDLQLRIDLEAALNERLGWTGLGHCDGGDMGSGEMSVFCFVVDGPLAKALVEQELPGTPFAVFSRVEIRPPS
ncbi:MAG: hypothetical protein VX899_27255 [Myxococcota bacterium]|nr:hypothetical protein [Myxococcota bacterium]